MSALQGGEEGEEKRYIFYLKMGFVHQWLNPFQVILYHKNELLFALMYMDNTFRIQ